jgi:hypothetical protein
MKSISFLRKLLVVIVSFIVAFAAFVAPAKADSRCTVTGGTFRPTTGEYKVDVFVSPSFSSALAGSVVNGASLNVKRELTDTSSNRWSEYSSSNTASKLAYIPSINITNCKSDDSSEAYQRGYRDGINAAKKALNQL